MFLSTYFWYYHPKKNDVVVYNKDHEILLTHSNVWVMWIATNVRNPTKLEGGRKKIKSLLVTIPSLGPLWKYL
jgi:hypothetical protein